MRASAVTRSTLRQQIADALRDEVLSGRLHSGHEFTVKEIADQYGVSATPVREALVDLSAQGLLDAVQHRGFRVHEYALSDYRKLIEARMLVADAVFRDLATRPEALTDAATTAALGSVRRRGEEARRAAAAGDLNVLVGYDLRFWRELSELFGNPYLADFLGRLRVQSWVCAVQLVCRETDLRGRLWRGHTELVDALLRGEAETARAVVSAYHRHALAIVGALDAKERPTGP